MTELLADRQTADVVEVGPDLSVTGLTVRFGGLVAVNDVSLTARGGRITGLLGPNGAGKSTTFNACTGSVRATSGHVRLGGVRLDRLSTSRRAALGLGRTFQRMELCDSMTVRENIALGREAAQSAASPFAQLLATRSQRREVEEWTDWALERCDIAALGGRTAGQLSTGQRRLVELARAIGAGFKFLLLDEPSSGLDVHETEVFGDILAAYVEDTGVGVLLVEHDMALVARLCKDVTVLDFGRMIFQGRTSQAMASEAVRAAYLGSSELDEILDDSPDLVGEGS